MTAKPEEKAAAVWVALDDLKKWEKNPRKFDHKIPEAISSLRRFGFCAPMVAWGSRKMIVAGHARSAAMRKVLAEDPALDGKGGTDEKLRDANKVLRESLTGPSFAHAPVRYREFRTQQEAEAYALRDNMGIGDWDDDGLAKVLEDLKLDGTDLAGIGWTDAQLAKMMPPPDMSGSGGDAMPATPSEELQKKWGTERGQLWGIGPHRLLCGDSTSAEDVARLMDGKIAVVMNTDPPYGIDYVKVKGGATEKKFGDIENDDLTDGAELQAFLEKMIRVAAPHLSKTCAYYLWHPMLTQGTFFAAAAAAAADILIHRQIIWVKPSLILTRSGFYHWRHELSFFGWRRGHQPPWYGAKDQTSVWEIGRDDDAGMHPTQKPVELFRRPMLNHSKEGELVYEPFSGSGSQLMAAQMNNRVCYAMELEPRYVAVALERLVAFGCKPERVA